MVFGAARVYTVTVPGPKWKSWFITLPIKSCYDEVQQTIRICETVGVESKFFLEDVFELSLARLKYEPQSGGSVVSLKVVQDDFPILIKRGIDILGSLCALILLAPVMLLTAVAIKLTSPGPIIFAQERFCLQKRRFNMYKFRTMVENAVSTPSRNVLFVAK